MVTIKRPDRSKVLEIQSAEGAFYWSGCAEVILRKHGLTLEVVDGRYARSAFSVVLRGSPCEALDAGLYEGPIEPALLSRVGLVAREAKTTELSLWDCDKNPLGTVVYSRFLVKRIPSNRQEKTEPYEYLDPDTRWRAHDITVQYFTHIPDGWTVLALGEIESNLVPVIVSNGRALIMGAPLFDIFAFTHAMPALTEGFFKPLVTSCHFSLERWLVDRLVEHAGDSGIDVQRQELWPSGFHGALSIRHDYDRPITRDQLDRMLIFYAERGIRSTWFLLVDKPPPRDQIDALLALGHEVALHSVASTLQEFLGEAVRFRQLTGVSARGFTCHGGIGSSGHLALTHNRWAIGAGMDYGEMIGRCRGLPHQLVQIVAGVPVPSPFMVQNCHHSLDLTTRPEGHLLDSLQAEVPGLLAEGGHVTIMNHPDIHWDELQALLSSIEFEGVWCANVIGVIERLQA
jgi:hypothetical protein